jgi:nicotinamide riboside transporter PnuC
LRRALPIIICLANDLWCRLIAKKKPYHHPERWPLGLIVYLTLLFMGCIGLNLYGYLISKLYGFILVIVFFIMMSSYGYYQYMYNKKAKESQKQ